MLTFYFNASPNPTRVALFLEEAGLEYEPRPIDTRKGEQFAAAYLAINPNGKVPAIVDGDATVFDTGQARRQRLLAATKADLRRFPERRCPLRHLPRIRSARVFDKAPWPTHLACRAR
jgi:hypothetical protein